MLADMALRRMRVRKSTRLILDALAGAKPEDQCGDSAFAGRPDSVSRRFTRNLSCWRQLAMFVGTGKLPRLQANRDDGCTS
jgi:hypothetical protein